MKRPNHRKAIQSFDSLSDEDLLAIIGNDISYEEPETRGNELILGIRVERTKEAIDRGRARLGEFLADAKFEICKRWRQAKSSHALDRIDVLTLVFEVTCRLDGIDPGWVTPVTLMICRSMNYQLDALCVGTAD